MSEALLGLKGFEWDQGNSGKNEQKHAVTDRECEEAFFNRPRVIAPSFARSHEEARYVALGKTNKNRLLTVVFTIRHQKIRVISGRPMSKKERGVYEKEAQAYASIQR